VANERAWAEAVAVTRDRLESRFLEPTRAIVPMPLAGFAVLALDCMTIEGIQRMREGRRKQLRQSGRLVTTFLRERDSFRRFFWSKDHVPDRESTCPCPACDFYRNVRCGLMHDGETQEGWLVRFGEDELVTEVDAHTRALDRNLFHEAVELECARHLAELMEPREDDLRKHLRVTLDAVCGIS
jgi:hypothetical protein